MPNASRKSLPNFKSDQNLRGLLPIVKPLGMSSRDVSRWLTRRFGRMAMGHVGTLDPAATGVLPILIGRATRLQDYLLDSDKVYDFEVSLGYETDTLDLEGQVVRRLAADHVTADAIAQVVPNFIGSISQTPPLYSAVKFRGRPLHKYARSGQAEAVNPQDLARQVEVYELRLLDFAESKVRLRVRCGKGTYVRVLAKDLAEKLGTCGTVTALCRRQSAGIQLEQCVSLDELDNTDDWRQYLLPIEDLSYALPRVMLRDPELIRRITDGQRVIADPQHYCTGSSAGFAIARGEVRGQIRVLLQAEEKFFGLGDVSVRQDQSMLVALRRGI